MSELTSCIVTTYAWNLTQDRIEGLAELLYKLETLSNIVETGNRTAERTPAFLSDLRTQCCAAGAEDPFPDMPLTPRFDGVGIFDSQSAELHEVER